MGESEAKLLDMRHGHLEGLYSEFIPHELCTGVQKKHRALKALMRRSGTTLQGLAEGQSLISNQPTWPIIHLIFIFKRYIKLPIPKF